MDNTSKTPRKKALSKPDVFHNFVEWMATFEPMRDPPNQGGFAKKFSVSEHTLSTWKQREDFWVEVKQKWKSWGLEKTTNVMEKFYRQILKEGTHSDIKLWLQYFTDWSEKHQLDARIQKSSVHLHLIEINKRILNGDDLKEIPFEVTASADIIQDKNEEQADNPL